MQTLIEPKSETFVDRRASAGTREGGPERRQFKSTADHLAPEVAELAQAVDQYKLRHRRRFITFVELHSVITELGYHK